MHKQSMQDLQDTSLLDAGNAAYLEKLYESYLLDPESVSVKWRLYFEKQLGSSPPGIEPIHSEIQAQFKRLSKTLKSQKSQHSQRNLQQDARDTRDAGSAHPGRQTDRPSHASAPAVNSTATSITSSTTSDASALVHEKKQTGVQALINAYRLLGHLKADIDPLNLREKPVAPELMLSYHHLQESDLNDVFNAGTLPGPEKRSLKQILQDLSAVYCGSIASEFMHIPESTERGWLQSRVEQMCLEATLEQKQKLRILELLNSAEGLEKYLAAKYPGAKRFSIEGVDSLVVVLDEFIHKSSEMGTEEIVLGMAHRGRLNVLVNILGKNPSQLFDEFEGKHNEELESGDVKYHQGFSSDVETQSGSIHLSLAFNPSHLEIVAPVVCGSVRARQERRPDKQQASVISVAIHGDAAFAGQGVVMETLNMSRTRAYAVGGTLHLILNNQIGFTTSNPHDARSTMYCSDIGKMMEIPIFHVNADDPESVLKVAQLSLLYREKFKKDVIIDLVGYRRHGHNEADEPAATQPEMYKIIRQMPTVLKKYSEQLIQENNIEAEAVEKLLHDYRSLLEGRQVVCKRVKNHEGDLSEQMASDWRPYGIQDWRQPTNTTVPVEQIKHLSKKLLTLPSDFVPHPRVKKLLEERAKMSEGKMPSDWGFGETLAYATLLNEGYTVRMTGQDCQRGTFFHRHAVLYNQTNGSEYTPLNHISKKADFLIYNSLLSEEAVLAFEYGYSTSEPKKLVIWEAQFGDFVNGAQVVIDQFISSGEHKWGRMSGLVLLLPHGYEGQGPEHSSARLERFLQLCAENNMQVCVPTTPAQMFHMLRRQLLRDMRSPLVVMTPKSILRHKLAVSTLEEYAQGGFLSVIPEIDELTPLQIKRIILCSGKVYYDLLEQRRQDKQTDIAIIRIEQLYPFPEKELLSALHVYKQAKEIVWCQEEPQNQGAWYSSQHHLQACLKADQHLRYAGRKPSSAPAAGYIHLHQEQQQALLKEALD